MISVLRLLREFYLGIENRGWATALRREGAAHNFIREPHFGEAVLEQGFHSPGGEGHTRLRMNDARS